jgi:hypothetical protein
MSAGPPKPNNPRISATTDSADFVPSGSGMSSDTRLSCASRRSISSFRPESAAIQAAVTAVVVFLGGG